MPELKEVLEGVLVKALNFTTEEVSSLYTDDGSLKEEALTQALSKHTAAVQTLRDKAKADREEQYKRGLREKGEEWEKMLKAAGVEIGDAKGEEAVSKLKDFIAESAKPSDLDDDKVKSSKLFRQREKELMDAIAAKDKEWQSKWQDRDAKEQREKTLGAVKSKAREFLDKLKPVLPEDPTKAKNQLRLLDLELEAMGYEIDEDGTIVIKDGEGHRVEGANGHPLNFEDFVKSKAEQYYDFQVSEKKGSVGDPSKGAVKGGFKLQKPANREAYAAQLAAIEANNTLSATDKAEAYKSLKEMAADLG